MKHLSKIGLLSLFFSAILLAGCNLTNNVENEEVVNVQDFSVEISEQQDNVISNESEKSSNEKETNDGFSSSGAGQADAQNDKTTVSEGQNENKILVVYFSRADENYSVGVVEKGNTAFLAEYVADYLDADMFEIKPVNPYPATYSEATDVAKKELNDNARPEYQGNPENWSDYDTIFLGYPIRRGDLPMVVYTFIESHDFDGKTVYLFNTHEGSGIAGTYNSLKNKLTTANVNTNGLPMRGTDARKDSAKGEVEKWLKGLGF